MNRFKRLAAVFAVFIFMLSGCGEKSVAPAPTPTPSPIPEKRVSFYAAGDNLIHNSVYTQADRNAPGDGFDFKPMYEYVADDIKNADIAYINQETILGGTQLGLSSYPRFNSPQELGRDMIELGFDVFSHATNHIYDKGEQGMKNTYDFYAANPQATMIGLYKKGEENIKILEREGVKIAFVNFTEHTNGLSSPVDSEFYVPMTDFESDCAGMVKTIKKAKERADFVVCCVHWGAESVTQPNKTQEKAAKILAENGCDVIIGTHSHAVAPIEFIGDCLVVYSLGNFISAQTNPINLMGLTVKLDFVIDGDEKRIENVAAMPVINQYEDRFSNIRIIPFDKYSASLAASHGAEVEYEYFKEIIQNTIDEKYLDNF